MIITVEISFYPLSADYEQIVIDFIKKMGKYTHIEMRTTAMSTYLIGEFQTVMTMLTKELEILYKSVPQSSTVIKIIPQELDRKSGYLKF